MLRNLKMRGLRLGKLTIADGHPWGNFMPRGKSNDAGTTRSETFSIVFPNGYVLRRQNNSKRFLMRQHVQNVSISGTGLLIDIGRSTQKRQKNFLLIGTEW